MIDIHTHILPGIDDGAKSIDETIKMLKLAEKDGITDIIATPHISDNYSNTPEQIMENINNIKNKIKNFNININIHYGAEVYLSMSIFKYYEQKLKQLTINQNGKYILVELPFLDIPYFLDDILIMLKDNNIIPIIVHPLRNVRMLENVNIMKKLKNNGFYFQINKNAVLNGYSVPTFNLVQQLIKNNLISVISSDAHSIDNRRPTLKKTYNKIYKAFDQITADLLFINNPQHILYSEPLDSLPLNKTNFFDKIKKYLNYKQEKQ